MINKIAMIGLGPMGKSLALNMKDNGIDVIGFDISEKSRESASQSGITTVASVDALANAFDGQKAFWIMVPSKFVDDVMNDLAPHLKSGDVIIEGGNSHFKDTERRTKWAKDHDVVFIGAGVSGGEEGARLGPCIMPGGDKAAYDAVQSILTAIAADVNGDPCVAYIGPGGAGHFVKTVHNGIEYAMMQSIAEIFHLLREGALMTYEQIHATFEQWSQSERLGGYLTEITTQVIEHKDAETGRPFLEVVLDTAGQKGTGKWTSQIAYDLGVPVHTISAALLSRFISADNAQRKFAATVLHKPTMGSAHDQAEFIKLCSDALFMSIISAYAQGFQLLRAGSQEFGFDLDFFEIAKIWRGGCIIRSRQLEPIMEVFRSDPDCVNLLTSKTYAKTSTDGIRLVASYAMQKGIPIPALSMVIAYYDSLRYERLPSASVIQGQRDFFGSHTYKRIDKDGVFHTLWSGDRSEVVR